MDKYPLIIAIGGLQQSELIFGHGSRVQAFRMAPGMTKIAMLALVYTIPSMKTAHYVDGRGVCDEVVSSWDHRLSDEV